MSDEYRNVDFVELIKNLKIAQIKYASRIGSYKQSQWKEINENKVSNSSKSCLSLITNYENYNHLSSAQIAFAKKLIKNANQLG